MKNLNLILKNLRYLTIMLAFFITVQLHMSINFENKIFKNNNNNNKHFFSLIKFNFKKKTTQLSNKEKENFKNFNYFIDIIGKCGLAFILGALISERRFIKIGKI